MRFLGLVKVRVGLRNHLWAEKIILSLHSNILMKITCVFTFMSICVFRSINFGGHFNYPDIQLPVRFPENNKIRESEPSLIPLGILRKNK